MPGAHLVSIGGVPLYVDDTGNPVPFPGQDEPAVSDPSLPSPAPAPEEAQFPVDPGQTVDTTRRTQDTGSQSSSTVNVVPAIEQSVRTGLAKVDKSLPGVKAVVNAELDPFAEAERQIAEQESRAAQAKTDVETKIADANAVGAAQLATLTDRYGLSEKQGAEQARARTAQVAAEYRTQLASYAASEVDPSRLWKSLKGPGQYLTLVAAFVTDFLGAKGIKTSAMDHFNRAVDRDISAQIENIRTQGQVTDQFKTLWDMSIQDGATEAEARQRIYGYYLAGAQRAVAAEVAKYGGQLAMANGAEAQSAISQQLVSHLAEIENTAYTRYQAEVKQLLETEFQTQSLAIQRSTAATSAGHLRLERDKFQFAKDQAAVPKKDEGAVKDLRERIVFDPDHPDLVIGTAASKEDASKIKEDLVDSAALRRKVAAVRDAMQTVYNGPGKGLVNDAAEISLRAAWTDLTTEVAHSKSGTQYAEEFRKAVGDIIPLKTWTNDNVDALVTYSEYLTSTLDDTQNTIGGRLNTLTPSEAALFASGEVGTGSTYQLDKERRAEADALRSKNHGAPDKHSPVQDAAGLVNSAHKDNVTRVDRDLAEDAAAAGLPSYDYYSGKQQKAGEQNRQEGGYNIAPQSPTDDPYLPEWALGIRDLWLVANDAGTDDVQRKKAVDLLVQYAGDGADQDRAMLAGYYYERLEPANPNRPR